MTAQGLEVIDHTVQTTHEWINELADRLEWTSKRNTLRLLRNTLHHVRDHLLINEVAQFSAQLPLLIRGMMFEEWVPKNTPIRERSADAFEGHIRTRMGDTFDYRGQLDIISVFELLNTRLSAGEINDIRACLPTGIRELWPSP